MTDQTVTRHKHARNDLTAEYVRSILDYDKDTGIFRWKYVDNRPDKWNRKCAGRVVGSVDSKRKYVRINIDGKLYLAHRLAWLYVKGEWPKSQIDHIDGNPSNNSLINLRDATSSDNNCNRRRSIGKHPKGIGVFSRNGHTYIFAHIKRFKKKIYLGMFNTEEEAHLAYCEAALKYHGEFARTE